MLRAGDSVRLGAVELEMSAASGDQPLDDPRSVEPAPIAPTGRQAGRLKRVGVALLAAALMYAALRGQSGHLRHSSA